MSNLKWEYCECGCKGSMCGNYWIYDTLKGKIYLQNGHGFMSGSVGEYTSMKEINDVVRALIRAQIYDLKTLIGEN